MSEIDPIALRNAFGSFMTGVTVVTTVDASGKPVGFTANSFSSVSLAPPLLSVCPSVSMSSFELFDQCEYFQVSVLGQHQQDVSNIFASPTEDRFADIEWHKDDNGCPVIDNALASFSCRRWQSVPAGDHVILLGEVTGFDSREGLGLGYFRGGYFSLDMERRATEAQSSAHEAHQPVVVGALLEWRDGLLLIRSDQDDSNFMLPEVAVEDDQPTFDAIKAHIQADLNVEAKVGSVYSVFDHENSNRSSIYYRVNIDDETEFDLSDASGIVHQRLDQIDPKSMGSRAVKNMMERYLAESRSGNHRLYIGSERRGRTHLLSEES